MKSFGNIVECNEIRLENTINRYLVFNVTCIHLKFKSYAIPPCHDQYINYILIKHNKITIFFCTLTLIRETGQP